MQHVTATVAPVFGVILIGLMCGRLRLLSDGAAKAIVEFVFRVAVPALMFRTMALAPPPESSPLALWGAFFGAIAVVWLLATLASRFVLRRPAADAAALSLAASFGNLVMLGLPIVFGYLGTAAATPAALILLVEFPLMWLAATVQLQFAVGGARADVLAATRRLALDLGRNPIILGLAAGVLWRLTGLGLASVPDRTLTLLAQAAAPGSLFALGLSLANFGIRGQAPTAVALVVLKLAALPAAAWALAFHVFDLSAVWASVVVIFASMPIGTVAFIFATQYERAAGSISAAIAVSVALSALTISTVLFLLGPPPEVPSGPPA